MIFNIPATARELPEGVLAQARLSDGSVQALNQGKKVGYMGMGAAAVGPYPHYTFELFALDTKLNVGPDATNLAYRKIDPVPATRSNIKSLASIGKPPGAASSSTTSLISTAESWFASCDDMVFASNFDPAFAANVSLATGVPELTPGALGWRADSARTGPANSKVVPNPMTITRVRGFCSFFTILPLAPPCDSPLSSALRRIGRVQQLCQIDSCQWSGVPMRNRTESKGFMSCGGDEESKRRTGMTIWN